MYSSTSYTKIVIALGIGLVIISIAWVTRSDPNEQLQEIMADIPVAVAPKREPIAVTDSNQDGVPDWQEAFSSTNPLALTSASSTFTTPDTLTEQFALSFFEQMVRNKTYGDFGASPDEFVDLNSDALLAQASDELLTKEDITTSPISTPTALSQYGEAIAHIIVTHSETGSENEAVILSRVLENGDPKDIEMLERKEATYKTYLNETKKLAVPQTVSREHLALLNSYQAVRNDIAAMRYAQADPMLALLRLKRYQDDADGLYFSIVNLYTALLEQGATWPTSSVVYQLIALQDN